MACDPCVCFWCSWHIVYIHIMDWLLSIQFGWVLFSVLSGPEEAAWSYPWREFGEKQFPMADKKKYSKKAHRFGWFAVAVIGVVMAFMTSELVVGEIDAGLTLAFCFLLAFEYSIVFDGSYGLSIGQNFFFIGNTAETDQRIGSKGKLKFFVLLILSIAINILIYFVWL